MTLAILSLALGGQGGPSPRIVDLENKRARAQKEGDHKALERITSPDFVEITSDGKLQGKKELLTAGAHPEFGIHDLGVQAYGDIAIVTGVRAGSQRSRFLHVWHRERGDWRNVLAQSTNIAPSPSNPAPAPATVAISPTVWPSGKTLEESRVLEAQRALNETLERRDVEAYSRLTAEPFVRITADGRAIPRAAFMQDVATGGGSAARQSPNHSDFRVRIYGSVATLVYFNFAAESQRITRVFVQEQGVWKQTITQATVVAPASEARK